MRVLLDTHAFLWFVTDDPQLSSAARAVIVDPVSEVLVSPASYWEIAIKVRGSSFHNRVATSRVGKLVPPVSSSSRRPGGLRVRR